MVRSAFGGQAGAPAGYPMIEELQIKNFRCFEEVSLSGLKRVNIVVGENASGKTALLEGIFLAAADGPGIVLRYRGQRGTEEVTITLTRTAFEDLWRDLFFNFDQERTIFVSLQGSRHMTRSVVVAYSREESLTLPLGQHPVEAVGIRPIDFKYRTVDGTVYTIRPEITEKGLTFGGLTPSLGGSYFAANIRPGRETAIRFSNLSKDGKEGVVIQAIQQKYPFIESLSVEAEGDQLVLHAKVQGVARKMPIGLVSGGVGKLANILIGIMSNPRGVVLVDEIENGLYYSKFTDIVATLYDFAREHETQLFLSTHSMELLEAVLPFVENHEEDFTLVRTERENGKCAARLFKGQNFRAALEQRMEVR